MFSSGSIFGWNGNSFADLDPVPNGPMCPGPVAPWKLGISQAAMMRGEGVV